MSEDRPKRKYDIERCTQKIIDGKKECSKCHQMKLISDFWKSKDTGTGYTSQCKECKIETHRKWEESPEGILSRMIAGQNFSWRRRGINITVKEYNELLLAQGGKCAICGVSQSECEFALAVDHNHKTGQVRGLLCNKCNFVVGALESHPDKIEPAKNYLIYWEQTSYGR